MSNLIKRNEIPEAYVRGYGYRSDIFSSLSTKTMQVSAAQLLLDKPSTAISWLDTEDVYEMDGCNWLAKVLVAANLHKGHSDAKHKIIIQDPKTKLGTWVLYAPPNSGHTTFYLGDPTYPDKSPTFVKSVANPLKILNWYITDSPTLVKQEFVEMGYTFIDSPMPRAILDELSMLE